MSGLAFSKWEGLGNDFIVLDARQGRPPDPCGLALELCRPHLGIGADGLVLLTSNGRALGMEIYNADGSSAVTCGNALRCLAAHAVREGLSAGEVTFSTPAGPRQARVLSREPWWVEVDMGEPVPLGDPGLKVEVDGPRDACGISLGNPHLVVFVDQPVDLMRWGPHLQRHGPLGEVNVEFTRVLAPDHLSVQVYERGAGATLACGSGACAALAAAARTGRSLPIARVDLPGGTLEIALEGTVR
ncbi:MAG: diaminopimelate epimerase, partial [Candidatus Eremiobacterota bacterium]